MALFPTKESSPRLSDCVFKETRWRPRGSSRIKEIKSVEIRVQCLANFNFITQTTGPVGEHDELADLDDNAISNFSPG